MCIFCPFAEIALIGARNRRKSLQRECAMLAAKLAQLKSEVAEFVRECRKFEMPAGPGVKRAVWAFRLSKHEIAKKCVHILTT